jgi:signal transduction histidine kinase
MNNGNKRKIYKISILFFILVITLLHYLILQEQSPLVVLEELYYIPLLFGAILFGLKGALVMYMFASLSYLPFFFGSWTATFLDLIDRLLHLLFTGVFAFLAGFLVDRERKRQKQMEKDKYLSNIGQVTTTIVHDLKNTLIVILGLAKRIRNGKGNISGAAQTIIESAENMQKIVNDVLDFSKPIKLELKEEDLVSIVRKACDYCKSKADERGVSLSADLPDHPVDILIDGFAFQRALVNLINNAIEASEREHEVTVKLVTRKNFLLIRIKDQGLGMDRDTLENVFTPFYTKKKGGTGLGMAIAKKIIDGHQGKIHIESQPGLGTEVIIELLLKIKI